MAIVTMEEIAKVYVYALGRPADTKGAKAWQKGATAENLGYKDLIVKFLNTDDAKAEIGAANDSNEAFVEHLYNNIFGRPSDAIGKAYWVGRLNEINDKAQLIIEMTYPSAMGSGDKAVVDAKNALSLKIANLPETTKIENADFQNLNKILNGINENNIAEQTKAFDDILAKASQEKANVVELTDGEDTLAGTEGNDVFDASVSFDKTTLQENDSIDGGEGYDTLKINLENSFGPFEEGKVKNIDKLDLINESLTGKSFDATNLVGIKDVELSGAKGVEVENLANVVNLIVNNQESGDIGGAFFYNSDVKKDTQKLTVDKVGSKEDVVNANFEGFKALDITTKGEASFLNTGDTKALSLSGDADLTLTTGAKAETLDASKFEGKLNADLSEATVKSVVGGSGDDTITVKALSPTAKIDGGAGKDTLVITELNTKVLQPTFTNIESLTIDKPGNDLTLSMAKSPTIKDITISSSEKAVTIAKSALTSLNFTGESTGKVKVADPSVRTINFKAASKDETTANAKVSVDSSRLDINVNAQTASDQSTVTAAKASRINLNVDEAKAKGLALETSKLKELNITTKATDFKLTSTNDFTNLSNLVVKGEGAGLTIDKAIGHNNDVSNLALNLSGLAKASVLGNLVAKNSISLKTTDVLDTFKTGTLTAKDINIKIDTMKSVELGAITADSVNLDLSSTLEANTLGKIETNVLNYKGSNLTASKDIELAIKGGTIDKDFTANLVGSLGDDKFKMDSGVAKTFKITGDLDMGDDTLTLGSSSSTLNAATIDISGLKGLETSTIHAGTDLKTFKGSDGDDTITLAVGKGKVTLTGGAGNDKFDISKFKADTEAKNYVEITDFAKGDTISFGNEFSNVSYNKDTNAFDKNSEGFKNLTDLKSIASALAKKQTDSNSFNTYFDGKDTYVLAGKTSGLDNSDLLVKLAGFTGDLTAQDLGGGSN